MTRGQKICAFIEHYCLIPEGAQFGSPVKLMKFQRKKEAEVRQRQIAATIRYISWGLITALSISDFALLYFSKSFCGGLSCYCWRLM
jgi:hypothetical protein